MRLDQIDEIDFAEVQVAVRSDVEPNYDGGRSVRCGSCAMTSGPTDFFSMRRVCRLKEIDHLGVKIGVGTRCTQPLKPSGIATATKKPFQKCLPRLARRISALPADAKCVPNDRDSVGLHDSSLPPWLLRQVGESLSLVRLKSHRLCDRYRGACCGHDVGRLRC